MVVRRGLWVVLLAASLGCSEDAPEGSKGLDEPNAGKGGGGAGGAVILTGGTAGMDAGSGGVGLGGTGGSATGGSEAGGAAGTSGTATAGTGGMPLECPNLDVACNGACVAPGETHEGCHVIYAGVDFENSVNDLFAVGEDLYFATDGRISRISDGGPVEDIYLAPEPKHIEELSVSGDSVYFLATDGATQTIERTTTGGAAAEVITTVPSGSVMFDLQVFDDYVCVLEDETFEQYLYCAPLAGGDLLDSGYDVWQYLPLGNDLVFYGSNDEFGGGTLQRGTLPVPFASTPTPIASPSSFVSVAVSVDGDSVYFVDLNGISRVALAGGTQPEPVFAAELGQAVEIIGGEGFVYTNGELQSVELSSGTPSKIAQVDTFGVDHLARTTSRVYVADIYRFVEITPVP